MNSQQLFHRSRLQLAACCVMVMGSILSLSALGIAHTLMHSNWMALEREIESTAGTLHDSLEPLLPPSNNPTQVLQQIFPDLCIVGQLCNVNESLIQRHTTGISDRTTYYVRVFDRQGQLLAFSPNQPEPPASTLNPDIWQILQTESGDRYRQFTITLHSTHTHEPGTIAHQHPAWGYLQVGRTLTAYDSETRRLGWILMSGVPLTLGLVAIASWWLSGVAMKPIYQSYQTQQQFTTNAAHELRSPLASLLATVEAILRLPPDEPDDTRSMLQTVERQGRRLSQLVTDLLFLSRLEHDPAPHPLQPCCLNDVIADLTEEFAEFATTTQIHLSHQQLDDRVIVMGHESQLYRLVSNLLANAIQYTPDGGSIHIRLEKYDRTAIISVNDTGVGIAPSEQDKIFDRFYRVESDRSRKTGGTGLGLAIAQAIVDRHQGQISVESKVDHGSTFTVQLPCILSSQFVSFISEIAVPPPCH
jgi:two-component Ni(II)/redox sensor kinase NrsS